VPGPYQGVYGFTVFNWMLPYIENQRLYDLCVERTNAAEGFRFSALTVDDAPNAVAVPAYICPDEPNPMGQKAWGRGVRDGIGGPTNWGTASYAANYFVFGNVEAVHPRTGRRGDVEGNNKWSAIVDGTSNTVMFGERYANCTNAGEGRGLYTVLWSDATSMWRPVFCLNNISRDTIDEGFNKGTPEDGSYLPGHPPCAKFQVQPHWEESCDTSRAQSPHSGGMNVCLADASVRFVSGDIDENVWALVCDASDEQVIGGDW